MTLGAFYSQRKALFLSLWALYIFDTDELNKLSEQIKGFVLNETQKSVYLKENVVITELTEIRGADGVITRYSQGQIADIRRPDGALIKDIAFDSNNSPRDFTYIKDGLTYRVESGSIKEVSKDDGSATSYYSTSFVRSMKDKFGRTREFNYGIGDSKIVTATDIKGVFDQLNLEASGASDNAATLRLNASADPDVRLLAHLDGDDNATRTIDSSVSGHTAAFYGDAHIDSSRAKFGATSLELDGDGDYIYNRGRF